MKVWVIMAEDTWNKFFYIESVWRTEEAADKELNRLCEATIEEDITRYVECWEVQE